MPGKVHTTVPTNESGKYGEYIFAQQITAHCDDEMQLWFSKDDLRNVPEIDAIAIHPKLGLFIFEIKGHSISQVNDYKDGTFISPAKGPGLKDKEERPKKQVMGNQYKLRDFLELNLKNTPPWINCGIAFPNISRAEWEQKIGLDFPTSQFFFKDDLASKEDLNRAFQKYQESPLFGAYPENYKKAKTRNLEQSIAVLNGEVPKFEVSPEEQEAIKNPKDNFRKKASKYLETKTGVIRVDGKAGTGKTLFLIEWLQQRAFKGESVVFLTFNKCLASELRRTLTSISPITFSAGGSISIYDLYELKNYVEESSGIGTDKKYKQLGMVEKWKEIVDKKSISFPKYDAIAIDEGQDLYDYFMPFIEKISNDDCTWMISHSAGQQLYNFENVWEYPEIQKRVEIFFDKTRLNKQFRSSKNSTLVGQSFDENYPNLEKAISWISEKQSDDSPDAVTLFSEPERGVYINWKFRSGSEIDFDLVLMEFVSKAFARNPKARPLIIVNSESEQTYKAVIIFTKKHGLAFKDFVAREFKRQIAEPGEIRISTVHSARGVEADDVLIINPNLISNRELNGIVQPAQKPLTYIGFTRQKRELTVLVDPFVTSYAEKENDYLSPVQFLYELTGASVALDFQEKRSTQLESGK